jgi:multidrug transporter EmrE-like cation transporter
MDYKAYILFLIAAIAAAIPPPLLKAYNETGKKYYVVFSVISYLVLIMSYILILRDYEMSTIYPFLKILSILIVVGTGLFIFQEKLTGAKMVGIILGLVAMYLLTKE